MRRLLTNALAASLLLFATTTFAQDRTDMDSSVDRNSTPATRMDRPATTTSNHTNATANDDTGFNPGWFGLAGLIGLLGLMPRDNTRDRFDRTHTAGTTTTGVNR